MTAQIFDLSAYRNAPATSEHVEIDLVTAVDAAIRDLREIIDYWGSVEARQRAEECELMLRRAFHDTVAPATQP